MQRATARGLSAAVLLTAVAITYSTGISAAAESSSPPSCNPIFLPATTYDAGLIPRQIAVGDLNRDGHPDLVVANGLAEPPSGPTVSVLLGREGGTFGPRSSVPVELAPRSVALGDFNGDGFADAAVAGLGQVGISILLGRGDGTFSPAPTLSVGSATYVVIADLNRDGRQDLVYVGSLAGATPLFGHGDGTFESSSTVGDLGVYTPLWIGDLNADSVLDIVGRTGCSVVVRMGLASGGFGPEITSSSGFEECSAYAFGDWNGDGRLDVVVSNGSLQGLGRTFFGQGDGTFSRGPTFDLGAWVHNLVAADFNGDGLLDLAAAESLDAGILILLGRGDGTFESPLSSPAWLNPLDLVASDMNGDGRQDLVTSGTVVGGGSVSVLLNQGPPLPLRVAFEPRVLGSQSKGGWLRATIGLPPGVTAGDVWLPSIRIAGSIAPEPRVLASGGASPAGESRLALDFDRGAFQSLGPGTHQLSVTGCLTDGKAMRGEGALRIAGRGEPPAQAFIARVRSAPGVAPIEIQALDPAAGPVALEVFDISGRLVRSLPPSSSGQGSAAWDGRGSDGSVAASGVYFVRARVHGRVSVLKAVIAR